MQTPSITQELLALPEIGAEGVIGSIVFAALPQEAQQSIRDTSCEQERVRLAAIAGDKLPLVQQMHEHFIAAPARRKAQGLAFPALATLDNFPVPGLLTEGDRTWLREGQKIARIETQGQGQQWEVCVAYKDGQRRSISAERLCDAIALTERVRVAAIVLGMLDVIEP